MPTYQYACTAVSCGHQFDAVQAFSDNALTDCPECSGRLRKVWGSIGVVFKGSGFYRNDSRESAKKAEAKEGEGKTGAKDSAEAKSGAKATSDTSASTSTTSSSDSGASSKPVPAKPLSDAPSSSKRKSAAATS